MRRRGFLGSLITAVAATKMAPVIVGETLKAKPAPLLASGVVSNTHARVKHDYEHQGMNIIVPDDSQPLGWHTQHLGKNGVLVARSYPDGSTEIYDPSDETVVRSLFK